MVEEIHPDHANSHFLSSSIVAFIGILVFHSIFGNSYGLLFCLFALIISKNPRLSENILVLFLPVIFYSFFIVDESAAGVEIFYIISMTVISSKNFLHKFYFESFDRIMAGIFLVHSSSIFTTLVLNGYDISLILNIFLIFLIYPTGVSSNSEILNYRESYLLLALGFTLSSIALQENLLVNSSLARGEYEIIKTLVAISMGLFFFQESSRKKGYTN